MNFSPSFATLAIWAAMLLGMATVAVTESRAASGALIVAGLSGTSANEEEFERLSGETKRLLAERGIALENVQTLGGKVTREIILEKLAAAARSCSAEDEFWLVLYGHGGRSQGGAPAFQVSGPRLTAPDLKTSLDAIPARQFVFVGTSDSGAFLPLPAKPAPRHALRHPGRRRKRPAAISRRMGQRAGRKSQGRVRRRRGAGGGAERKGIRLLQPRPDRTPAIGGPIDGKNSRRAFRCESAVRRRRGHLTRRRPRRGSGRHTPQGVERGGHSREDQRPRRAVGTAARHRCHAQDHRRRTRRGKSRRPCGVGARTTPQPHHRGGPHDGYPDLLPGVHRARGGRRGLGQPVSCRNRLPA